MVSGLLQLMVFLATARVVCVLVEGVYRRIEDGDPAGEHRARS